jgi:hypothetical protein
MIADRLGIPSVQQISSAVVNPAITSAEKAAEAAEDHIETAIVSPSLDRLEALVARMETGLTQFLVAFRNELDQRQILVTFPKK